MSGPSIFRLALTITVATVGACAGATTPPSTSGPNPGRASWVLLGNQIDTSHAITAYDAVLQRRPHFLNPASGHLATERIVYLNGRRLGGVDTLREIPSGMILRIRFLGGPEAHMRYGAGHAAGAIEVTTRSGL
jgi:hypothetical protein